MYSPAFPNALGGIRTPTLVVWGNEDRIIPVECGRLYQEAIPGANLEVLDACGHWPHFEQPGRLASAISKFLST
jgi:2-hydroxy-6-oxo-octa-2,4-dienoate hydrolase